MPERKSFVINNDFAQLTKSHIVQLFKPSYNPRKGYFPLQYYPQKLTGTRTNPVINAYNKKNVVAGLFLVTENFLSFINKLNTIWYSDVLPKQIVPVKYSARSDGSWVATADTSRQNELVGYFSGPGANWASSFLGRFENYAKVGIEGSGTSAGVVSSSVHELLLRHLYSTDPAKRNVAFNVAQNYYGISAAECAAAKNEMFPTADFNSDNFEVTMEDDVITFKYDKPIALANKYIETVHNNAGANLYLYFPYITSNAMRPNSDANYDYRDLISLYTGPKNDTQATNDKFDNKIDPSQYFANTFVERPKNDNQGGIGDLKKHVVPDMPTLTNTIWSATKSKMVNQAGYTALQISEVGGGGDVQFDHIDKIDYIDSLTIEITVPTVFS